MAKPPNQNRTGAIAEWRTALAGSLALLLVLALSACRPADDLLAPAPPRADAADATVSKQAARDARESGDLEPSLIVIEPQIGRWLMNEDDDSAHVYIMPGQPVQFSWKGVGGSPLGNARIYRYGWNVADPDDPDDPGWAVPPGSGVEQTRTESMVFWGGLNELTMEFRDGETVLVRAVIGISAEPARCRPQAADVGPSRR
jgi:hypothetical protein